MRMYGMNKILGFNFWQSTKVGTHKTVLFVPRQMGYDHYCEVCTTFHTYLLLEVIKCDLKNGIKITMCMNEEEALYL